MGERVCWRGLGHMIKLANISIYRKKKTKNLLQNRKANDFVAWFVAPRT